MLVCCEGCVLSGRGLCDELITRPEESCRLWFVVVYDLETLKNEAMTYVGSQRHSKKIMTVHFHDIYVYHRDVHEQLNHPKEREHKLMPSLSVDHQIRRVVRERSR
jgi:hypothetical protein